MARHFASVDGDGVGNCVTRGDSRDGLVSGKIIHHCQTYLLFLLVVGGVGLVEEEEDNGASSRRGPGGRRRVLGVGRGGGKLEITINQFVLVALLLLDNDDSFDEESKVGCLWMFGMAICQRW